MSAPLTLQHLRDAGATSFTAEALSDLGWTYEQWHTASPRERVDAVLQWHGIIGYTSNIIDLLEENGWEQLA